MNHEDRTITTELHPMNYVFQQWNANPGGIVTFGRTKEQKQNKRRYKKYFYIFNVSLLFEINSVTFSN